MIYQWSRQSTVEPKVTIYFEHQAQLDFTEKALRKIKSGENGSSILKEIADMSTYEKSVLILVDDNSNSETGGELTYSQMKRFNVDPEDNQHEYRKKLVDEATNGKGVRPVVYYNPLEAIEIDRMNNSWAVRNSKLSYVTLAHELVHALHLMKGDSLSQGMNRMKDDPNIESNDEEYRATGINQYSGSKKSENGVRSDHGLPLRASYFTLNELEF